MLNEIKNFLYKFDNGIFEIKNKKIKLKMIIIINKSFKNKHHTLKTFARVFGEKSGFSCIFYG